MAPIYAFRCAKCRSEQDRHLGFDQKVTDLCECGGELTKVFRLAGVQFRGNGFYRTDNQTNAPKEN